MSKISLSKEIFTAVSMFTADMAHAIGSISDVLHNTFQAFKNGECGIQIQDATLRLFNEWLTRSLLPRIEETVNLIMDVIEKTTDVELARGTLKKKLSAFTDVEKAIIEIIAEKMKGEPLKESVNKRIWTIYSQNVDAFCIQTAHLIVGRLLMLYVGVNKGAWKKIEVQVGISNPHLNFYWISRSAMSGFLPTIYYLNELDWLYISDTIRQGLTRDEARVLKFYEDKLDRFINRINATLTKYDYSQVDMDLWKAVYQGFLPPEEINRLGFVTTPDEIVDSILDLVNYKEGIEGLCCRNLLDPACGSGTFLIEALTRLKKHFEIDMPCHKRKPKEPVWIWEKDVLERIISNIQGIDIHPFATFLTTVNLTFQLIDIYSRVKHKYPDFALFFNIVTHDALAEPSIRKIETYINERERQASVRTKKYAELCAKKFDFVVGNPPWGAVLRGAIGPLGNEETRKDYKKRFDSATGKYDIFVLFMERGIEWLKEKGFLGMITQVMYVSQAFGNGIQKVIKKESALKFFVDLSTLGHIIFPRWTNYPAITILQKGVDQEEILLVEVKEK